MVRVVTGGVEGYVGLKVNLQVSREVMIGNEYGNLKMIGN